MPPTISYLLVEVLFVFLLMCLGSSDEQNGQGTTRSLAEVFTGRCWDYDVTKYNGLLSRVDANCDDIWNAFKDGFAYKEPCDLPIKNYDSYYQKAFQDLPTDKLLFWSGIYRLSHRYAEEGHRLITLEDTMIGYLANGLTWCGQKDDPGINYNTCPAWLGCSLEARESFWAGASTYFAQQGKGVVTLMVNGSNPQKLAYRKNSFFGKYELPSLPENNVTKVQVIVAHTLGQKINEKCGTGSLVTLKNDVEAKGFEYTCVDDPCAVLHLLCSDDPNSRECKLVDYTSASTKASPEQIFIELILAFVFVFVLST